METFSEKFRSLLAVRGISQKALAEAADLTQGAISKYLNGHQEPKSRELYSISKVLNVPMESWFSDSAGGLKDSDWKARAKDAEKKLESVKAVVRSLTDCVNRLEGIV
ncbi:MAG: helix-turn-helix transcriptional regulator [Kiritimatiellae bacterium]|nr:helix-turn-helix transcriptional regulator [Kiritimatiellia bacterium]